MKLYHVRDDYIAFLRQYDTKVADNKNEKRPYVGIVFEIDAVQYYAPLTSPKPKHTTMKNDKDFRKIQQGRYGAINFNNMIPVPESALLFFDFANEPDARYRRLLQNQYNAILEDWRAIVRTAEALHTLLFSDVSSLTSHERNVKARCCNLSLLEQVMQKYRT